MLRIFEFACLLLICNLQQSLALDREYRPKIVSSYSPDPQQHIPGVTYEKLQEVFQMYPIDQRLTNVGASGRCGTLHGSRETEHTYYVQHTYNGKREPRLKPCYSNLRKCWTDKDYMAYEMTFCVAANSSSRRYDSMKVYQKNLVFGRKPFIESNCNGFEYIFKYYPFSWTYPCICDCESSEKEVDRYFSLREVLADEDKVVTGIRIRKLDHVFYIQIQQGKLGRYKSIDGPVEWKDVEPISKSDLLSDRISEYYKEGDDNFLKFHENDLVYAVTGEQKKVLLKRVQAPAQKVVTGIKFHQANNALTLEILVTSCEFEYGLLYPGTSRWISPDVSSQGEEIEIETREVPSTHTVRTGSKNEQYNVEFQTSDWDKDLGQTTVPFIDIQDVAREPPSPLVAAEIYYKQYKNSAGFIALGASFETIGNHL